MLVTCPACGARYEIDGTLIPAEGRRVQCSSCDHVWLEVPAGRDAAALPETAATSVPDHDASRAAAPPPQPTPAAPTDAVAAGRTAPAEDIRAVLREEAEREARIRREKGLVELQPELGHAPRATAERAPRAAAEKPPAPEEVDEALRAASHGAAEERAARARQVRAGFASGVVVGLCIVAAAAVLYLGADWIGETMPALRPALAAYVGFIDALRDAVARGGAAIAGLLDRGP